jgi:aspartyl-tRNA(Asn)/glutamyl-tRNA(Gln) amidotransferase subunit C
MALTLDDVRRVAHLARIAIDETEAPAVLAQLTRVFALIAEIQAVDTRGVEPLSHALDVTQPLRVDSVTESDQHELFQSVAPHVEDGLYLVPKVIE